MAPKESSADLSRRLGHDFRRPGLLDHALTHASMLGVADAPTASNQRLEFLGDRVLGLVVADMLLARFPGEDEGMISQRHAALVRREALVRVARTIELGPHIKLAKSESGSGRVNPAILADTCEAVIAALYLDGGLEAARRFIAETWREMLEETPTPPKDSKTELQEWVQGRGLALPSYAEVARDGPPHAPVFTIEVDVVGLPPIQGQGASKRAAEQQAAERMLAKARTLKLD